MEEFPICTLSPGGVGEDGCYKIAAKVGRTTYEDPINSLPSPTTVGVGRGLVGRW